MEWKLYSYQILHLSNKRDKYIYDNSNILDILGDSLSPKEYFTIKIFPEENNNKTGNVEYLFEITDVFIKNGKQIEIGGLGTAFYIFLTRGNIKYMNLLKSRKVDFTKIFRNPQLLADYDLINFLNILKECSKDMDLIQEVNIVFSKGKYQVIHRNTFIVSKDPAFAKFSI